MKRQLFVALLIVVGMTSLLVARGTGGRVGGRIGWGGDGMDDAYDAGLPWFESIPGADVAYGDGGAPQLNMKTPAAPYNPLSGEQAISVPQGETEGQREQAFAGQLAGMGIGMGGFQPGQFGPPPRSAGLPSDMGMHVAGGKSPPGYEGQGGAQSLAAEMRVAGNAARSAFRDYSAFSPQWFAQRPKAWNSRGYVRDVWSTPGWTEVTDWLGGDLPDNQYMFGADLIYDGNTVYLCGRPVAAADKYYESAVNIARRGVPDRTRGGSSTQNTNSQWLPLGVYQAMRGGDKSDKSNVMLFQLAVNKAGVVRGNYYDPSYKNVQQLEGSVDKGTERVAWIVADRPNVVFDVLLYNLTQPETSMLVHTGADKQEQWTFVRLNRPAGNSARR